MLRNAVTATARMRARGVMIVTIFLMIGCGPGSGRAAGVASPTGFVNAEGHPVSFDDLYGRYVWVDFATEWCLACTPQTRAIKSVAAGAPDALVFITIMTSEKGGYGHPAARDTAARWAARFGLEPARVWAGDLSSQKLPRNQLRSPLGDILFDRIGELRAEEIRTVIRKHVRSDAS